MKKVIYDFCGFIMPGSFQADLHATYDDEAHLVEFWGDWCDIPSMPASQCPEKDETGCIPEVEAWVEKHERILS